VTLAKLLYITSRATPATIGKWSKQQIQPIRNKG
jgi:hypothetical protein